MDPLLVSPDAAYDQATLTLQLERYRLAAEYVRDQDVIDCACGTGFGSELLRQAGARSVQGVDLDRGALEFARLRHAHSGITYFEADALRYQPNPMPAVWVSLETLERLPHPDRYVARVAQILPAGARFVVSAPVSVTTDGHAHHLHDFTRDAFRRLLRTHGFREERTLEQSQRFSLRQFLSTTGHGGLRDRRRGLLRWYARHPGVLAQRAKQTLTRGLVQETLTVVAIKS